MPLLQIDLREGFRDDTVAIRINGVEAAQKTGVTTRTQIGQADSIKLDQETGNLEVSIVVSTKNLSERVDLQFTGPVYLGISLEQGRIVYQVSTEPFRYL